MKIPFFENFNRHKNKIFIFEKQKKYLFHLKFFIMNIFLQPCYILKREQLKKIKRI